MNSLYKKKNYEDKLIYILLLQIFVNRNLFFLIISLLNACIENLLYLFLFVNYNLNTYLNK
jgi:hypothetical protein